MDVEPDQPLTVDRRKILQAVGVSAVATLAGCNDNTGSSEDLGERVPTLEIEYWAAAGGFTSVHEGAVPLVTSQWENALGVDTEVNPVELTTQVGSVANDERTHHVSFGGHTTLPSRIDPHLMTRRFAIDWAGANGQSNQPNYASCEYSEPAIGQASASTESERQELINDATKIFSEDFVSIPFAPRVLWGAVRTDNIDVQSVGSMGVNRFNTDFFMDSRPTEREKIVAYSGPEMLQTRNFPSISGVKWPWTHLVHSSLLTFNKDIEVVPSLASGYEILDDAQRMVFELENAEFHNGDPVTAEDVEFTFEQITRDHVGSYPQADTPPYDEITVVDDKIIEFTFEDSYLPFAYRPAVQWGILHKDSWTAAGANEDPNDLPDELIGSGPFKIDDFDSGNRLSLSPTDAEHPQKRADHGGIVFVAYRDESAAFQSFSQGELDVVSYISGETIDRIDNELSDVSQTTEGLAALPYLMYPYFPIAPTKFPEFRQALGQSLNRREILDVVFPMADFDPIYESRVLLDDHPFSPPDDQLTKFTDQPQGDRGGARQALEDAGWGWDDDDNLRYPEDADLSPLWPEGETPEAGDFPCFDEEWLNG